MTKRRTHNLISPIPEHLISLSDALAEFILALRAEHRSPRTLEFYEQNCRRFATWCADNGHPADIQHLQAVHVRGYLSDLQMRQGVGDVSIQTYFRALRGWVNWCEREEMIPSSPFRSGKLRCPKAKQAIKPTYSEAEIHALLDACAPQSQNGLRDLAIVLLLLDTGIRASELCGLRLADLERGRLRVLGKGDRERYVQLSPRTERAIRDYVRRGRQGEQDWLFLGTRGALTRSGLYQVIEARAGQAGIVGKGLHMFRRTFAVQWMGTGGPLNVLQATLGHTSPVMSMRYAALTTTGREESHRQYSPVARLGRKGKG